MHTIKWTKKYSNKKVNNSLLNACMQKSFKSSMHREYQASLLILLHTYRIVQLRRFCVQQPLFTFSVCLLLQISRTHHISSSVLWCSLHLMAHFSSSPLQKFSSPILLQERCNGGCPYTLTPAPKRIKQQWSTIAIFTSIQTNICMKHKINQINSIN